MVSKDNRFKGIRIALCNNIEQLGFRYKKGGCPYETASYFVGGTGNRNEGSGGVDAGRFVMIGVD
jgi:hypothetical protein